MQERKPIIRENIYGHRKRLEWIMSFLEKEHHILEFGCGTGYMITIPLALSGYSVTGIDIDEKSIDYGRDILRKYELPLDTLRFINISELEISPDVVIASEVLEHMMMEEINEALEVIFGKLRPGGLLLVTVPNGYGFFELDNYLWRKVGLGKLITMTWLDRVVHYAKGVMFGKENVAEPYYSTLSETPHIQRFTWKSIRKKLENFGFEIIAATGSALICGPFSNLFFTGMSPVMKLNNFLGGRFPRVASGYYVAVKKPLAKPT